MGIMRTCQQSHGVARVLECVAKGVLKIARVGNRVRRLIFLKRSYSGFRMNRRNFPVKEINRKRALLSAKLLALFPNGFGRRLKQPQSPAFGMGAESGD